ncbi:MAG: asparagine synthase C-terminal domain-containing protein [Candidatus Bathyarchaeota archaeon]|nr:asparagine synthase C-terminal domain-containing protein [Candidatus Bathyarchaeota archaeon]
MKPSMVLHAGKFIPKKCLFKLSKNRILKTFDEVIKDYNVDAILLSGGLDTSILACLFSRYFKPYLITVGFVEGEAPDVYYAKLVAQHLKLPIHVKFFSVEEAKEAAKYVIKAVKSFDPVEIRNDIPIYVALKEVKMLGLNSVATGDGGDELFAGYSFLFNLKPYEVDKWIKDTVRHWFFASKLIGESLGLKVFQPFLDERIVKLALKIPAEFKITDKNGVKYGKWILREAFKTSLPSEIIWRGKHPIETGTGSVRLSEIFKVKPEEFNELSKLVKLDTQEQAYYLKLYLKIVGKIPQPRVGEKQCPKCGGGVAENLKYCKICGAYPV